MPLTRSKIIVCYANVNVSYRYESGEGRTAEKFGGLVGCNQRGEVYNSFAQGSVTGDDGANSATRVGGLAGCIEQGLVVNSFSTGLVSGSGNDVGGLIGNIVGAGTGGITDSYWDTQTSGQSSGTNGTGLTTAEMKTASYFSSWDSGFWNITNGSYPGLSWSPEYTLSDQETISGTLIYMDNRKYENTDFGGIGKYIAFQSQGTETVETYLTYATYSYDTTIDEVSDFAHPENLSAYCRVWFKNQSNADVAVTSLNNQSYFYIQMEHQSQALWYKYNGGSWQAVSSFTNVSGGAIPNYTYKVIISDLNLSSRYGSNAIEFAGDRGGDNPLPVTLSSFTAQYLEQSPVLFWKTQTESNNLGWNVYRGNDEDLGTTLQVNPEMIDGAGTTLLETTYRFIDQYSYQEGRSYYYWLESIDTNGTPETFGPIELYIPFEDNDSEAPEFPEIYGLRSNYPNPFNPETEISYILDYDSDVTLEIYNIQGKKVKTLIKDSSAEKGMEYTRVWNGCDEYGNTCSSGIYYYRLTTDRDSFIRKMMIVK